MKKNLYILALSLCFLAQAPVQADWRDELRLIPQSIQVGAHQQEVSKEEKYGNFWLFPGPDSPLEEVFQVKDAIKDQYSDRAALYVFVENPALARFNQDEMRAHGFSFLMGKPEGQIWLFDNGRGVPLAPHTVMDTRFLLVDFSGREPFVLLIQDPFSKEFTAPGGALQPGELPEVAARRKMKEELGIDLNKQALMYTVFQMNGPWKFLGEPVDGSWQGIVIPFRDQRPDLIPDPKQVAETAWVPLADLKPNLKIEDISVNPLVTQFATQINPETSAQNHVVLPDGRSVDTWMWHL